jgi:methyl-accepting chemotaxis protein
VKSPKWLWSRPKIDVTPHSTFFRSTSWSWFGWRAQANSLWGAMTFSNVGIGRKFAAGFACILVAVALTSATLFVILKSLDATALDNERPHKVVDDLQCAVNAVSEQARTARGYIIARDERLPPIYDAAVKDFATNIAQLRGDITGRPELLSLIDKVEIAGANWRNEVGEPMIRLTRDNSTKFPSRLVAA